MADAGPGYGDDSPMLALWWQNNVRFTFRHLGNATRLTTALNLELLTGSGSGSFLGSLTVDGDGSRRGRD